MTDQPEFARLSPTARAYLEAEHAASAAWLAERLSGGTHEQTLEAYEARDRAYVALSEEERGVVNQAVGEFLQRSTRVLRELG